MPATALILSVVLALVPVALPAAVAPEEGGATATRQVADQGLWPETRPPRVRVRKTRRAAEVGTRFSARTRGQVTGIQFYKAARGRKATPRRATLWDRNGKRLATVRIPRRKGRGWVTVALTTPVDVEPKRRYTVSVFAKRGRYALTRRYFRSKRISGELAAPKRGNGVVRPTGRSAFPHRGARRATSFWVDVVFRADTSRTTPVPPAPPAPPVPPAPPGPATFPTEATTGVPAGWTPREVHSGTYVVSRPGAVVEDLRVNGSVVVEAPDVTLRRVEVVGGGINNFTGGTCQPGLVVEDSTIRRSSATTSGDEPALAAGGYTARRVEINGLPEGFRVGGRASGCGPVRIEDSWARVVRPDVCDDWHGDGIQGYDGPALTVRSTTLVLVEQGCGGTAPFFYPSGQGNTSVDIDGLLVSGGGYSFRLGTPGRVRNLAIEAGSWHYGPIQVRCSALDEWSARVVQVAPSGAVSAVRSQPCNTSRGD